MNSKLTKDMTVGSIVAEDFNRAQTLEQMGIDYCCHGSDTLQTACEKKGLNADDVLAKLDGKEVSGEVQLQEGQELTLTYKITDKKCSFADKSDGAGGFIRDLFKPKERTISIPITANLDGTTVSPDDWFNIVKKGEAGK